MKKFLVFFIATLLTIACAKQGTEEEPTDKWNGYFKMLKSGEVEHILWAGKTINVGTATYGLDDNANFYVTYDCSATGWVISETHMFAGDKLDMPVNKPGKPKIGHFPNSADHDPMVSTFTYYAPLSTLPPYQSPGFTVASHAVVHGPNGENETAWAEGDYKFTDKGWGWYDTYYYDQPENPFTIVYGIDCTTDSLRLYLIDMTNGSATVIFSEFVGDTPGTYDGTAYDTESGNFFFTNSLTNDLWINQLTGDDASFLAGTLNGTAASATFYDGSFYYVDAVSNTINEVTFDANWLIDDEIVVDTIPSTVVVTDIAMDPLGENLYMVGNVGDGTTEMITWDVSADTYATIALPLNETPR